ncbi:ribosomal protein S18 acetylase RimI-like enzyme [Paenibacillus phyllosphaerae]|uniref:Ribosomal protein S18 acetylase RimI-like enzyme n=1 Tax=Paenibacillus phyllosphaerae TaxID=274593 RepID=A0A7W5B333_9BACL|nr:GNAT family N-acetyltransferase [Paenibacillus phyllosphaerae]MBB3113538.1 ribosomal protein S18 acetylase RimI-like enzyme [Paenibacillus phyllosphaerae]
MEFRSLHSYSLEDVVALWNEGFKGYFVDLTMTPDAFVRRLAGDQLSLKHSFALVKDGEPIGFVLNGLRRIDGKLVAWNGGTAVIPEYRLQGIGKLLMEEALKLYKREGVEEARLEAIKANEPAISLYKRFGYRVVDLLAFYRHEDTLATDAFLTEEASKAATNCNLVQGIPQDVQRLSFYAAELPWQSQWYAIQNGQSYVAYEQGQAVGYALFKRLFDEQGRHTSTLLYQCVTAPGYVHGNDMKARLLQQVFGSHEPIARRTMNWSSSHQEVVALLQEAGFGIQTEQVHMKLIMV